MKMNLKARNFKETLQKLRDGDHLTDEEISNGIEAMHIVRRLIAGIPEYHLMDADLCHRSMTLESYQRARKEGSK